MADDTRNFIEQTQARAVGFHGKELSPEEMATEFAKFDIIDRVDALDRLAADAKDSPLSVGEAAKQYGYARALQTTHERLRKVGR